MKKDFFHYGKTRLLVALILMAVAFWGVMLNEIASETAWRYWKVASLFFAAVCLGLNTFLRTKENVPFFSSFFHDILHWLGFLLAVFLLSLMVDLGIIGSYVSSLVLLLLLGLCCYLAGIYQDITFVFIGIAFSCIAALLCFATMYLYPLVILICVLGVALLALFLHKKRKEKEKE